MTARSADVRLPHDKPPDWANSLVRWALTTPGIQRMLGGALALLSFKGRKTGALYSIPVSYQREDGIVTIITKRQRTWWHNFESPREVELRLAGRVHSGKAAIETDHAAALESMTAFLEKRPVDAKAYGLGRRGFTRDDVARVVPHVVVIRVAITDR